MAIGVTVIRPACPEIVDQLVHGLVRACSPRPDAGADKTVDQHRHGFRRQRVVAHQIPHPVAQQRSGQTDFCISRLSARGPAIGAAAFGRTIVSAAEIAQRDPGSIALRGGAGRDQRHRPVDPAPADGGRRLFHRTPRRKPAKPATGSGDPPACAIADPMTRTRDRRSAALPYSTVRPSEVTRSVPAA